MTSWKNPPRLPGGIFVFPVASLEKRHAAAKGEVEEYEAVRGVVFDSAAALRRVEGVCPAAGKRGVKVTYTGMEQAEDGDVALHLAVENNSGQPIVVNVQEFSANRCQMAAFFASKVAAGETSHAVLTIPAGELERYGVDTVEEASFFLVVFHGDTLERILTTEQLHVDL